MSDFLLRSLPSTPPPAISIPVCSKNSILQLQPLYHSTWQAPPTSPGNFPLSILWTHPSHLPASTHPSSCSISRQYILIEVVLLATVVSMQKPTLGFTQSPMICKTLRTQGPFVSQRLSLVATLSPSFVSVY